MLIVVFPSSNRVVAIDQRGYGLSSKSSRVKDYKLDNLTGDIADVVEQLGKRFFEQSLVNYWQRLSDTFVHPRLSILCIGWPRLGRCCCLGNRHSVRFDEIFSATHRCIVVHSPFLDTLT